MKTQDNNPGKERSKSSRVSKPVRTAKPASKNQKNSKYPQKQAKQSKTETAKQTSSYKPAKHTNKTKSSSAKQHSKSAYTHKSVKHTANVQKMNKSKANKPRKPINILPEKLDDPLKIIPIGGLNEIGKNMMLLEYKDDIMIIDCGMTFPEDDMYGIDSVIPDFTYLVNNSEKVKGLILTHGHEDHIGGIPYLLKQIKVPIYGTRLTLGLVDSKLKEHGLQGDLRNIKAGDRVRIGEAFRIETIRTTHSIADSICLSIDTPAGRVFHTGDFKVDYTPVDGEPIDFRRLAEIGREGVDFLMADSTNAVRPGYTASESTVGKNLATIFAQTDSRIIIATFSSNVHRLQKIIDNAVLCKRKVAVSGRSMVNVVGLAIELGYLKIPEGVLVDINKLKGIPDNELVIITTGSQGEPMSALSRMATSDHKAVQIRRGDTVILSSSPVPGNEKKVSNVVNRLFEKGAKVIYSDIADVHVSGHACQEELKLIHSLIKPKYFVPVHGEYRHLEEHSALAQRLGLPEDHTFILDNGDVLTYNRVDVDVQRSMVPAEPVLVDGFGVGDVGNVVLRDRKMLSESGLIILVAAIDQATHSVVSGPDIISRGFVYVKENEELIEEARTVAIRAFEKCEQRGIVDWSSKKALLRDELKTFIYKSTGRSPIILPVFLDV
ncbi:MAG: RNase J family beta-CASP ribonuclease [Firmicutes bacterium]|nr:RNase J family beta-CASP ribonuclease [Bacillota bacterium]